MGNDLSIIPTHKTVQPSEPQFTPNEEYISYLKDIEQILISLSESNVESQAQLAISKFDVNFPDSFNLIISRLIISSYISQKKDINVTPYIEFLKTMEEKEKDINTSIHTITDIFIWYLQHSVQQSNYFLQNMLEQNLCKPKIIKNINSPYFFHMKTKEEIHRIGIRKPPRFYHDFLSSIQTLEKDDWKLHKELIHKGVNPSEIAIIIRNDDVKKLQEISSQNNFDFNQKVEPSLYERYNYINFSEVSLIEYAAFFGSIECFKFLMLNNSSLDKCGKYAIAGGNLEIIHLCEQSHSTFADSLDAAIIFHRNDIFKYLYDHNIGNIKKLELYGRICIENNNFEILSYLEEKGIKITELMPCIAAENGNLFLIKHFIGENQYPNNILGYSASFGSAELVKYILKQNGININTKHEFGKTALMIACEKCHYEVVEVLLKEEGIDINAKDDNKGTALMKACESGNCKIVKLLLKQKGIDLNAKNIYEMSAFLYACKNDKIKLIKLLLEQEGIDINAKNNAGFTALIFVSAFGYCDILKLLLKQKGVNINEKNNYVSPLIIASQEGNVEIVKILLEQDGIDINLKNIDGETALIRASQTGKTEIVKLLLEQKGIDVNIKDKYERTALMWATQKGNNDIVKLFVERGNN